MDLYLPADASLGSESRTGGANGDHTLIVLFDRNVASGQATFVGRVGSISGSPTFSGNSRTVNLTGAADVQVITVRLTGLTDTSGQAIPDRDVQIRVLMADVNGDGTVNAGDALRARRAAGYPLHKYESVAARSDVNCDGSINGGDAQIVRARSGTTLE